MGFENFEAEPGASEQAGSSTISPLMTDRDIAKRLSFSESWVRQQRSNRRHGRPHVLALDPVYVGDSPRYPREEFEAWLHSLLQETPSLGENH